MDYAFYFIFVNVYHVGMQWDGRRKSLDVADMSTSWHVFRVSDAPYQQCDFEAREFWASSLAHFGVIILLATK